jgi:hypothetical protein
MAARGIAILIIPIIFSFVFGGAVFAGSMSANKNPEQIQTGTIKILEMQSQYAMGQKLTAKVSATGSEYDCGNLYITVYDISQGQKKAVKQAAFFDQCFGSSGLLPTSDKFSEQFDAGQYILEAQLFDKKGDKFVSASQTFTVQ